MIPRFATDKSWPVVRGGYVTRKLGCRQSICYRRSYNRTTGKDWYPGIATTSSRMETADAYMKLGVLHILTGVDHLLFILALIIVTGGRMEAGEDSHRVHRIPQHHTYRGDARICSCAAKAGRGSHRAKHRVRGLRDRPSSSGPFGIDRAVAVDHRAHLRAVARAWLCGSAERRRVACRTHSAGAALLQLAASKPASSFSSPQC